MKRSSTTPRRTGPIAAVVLAATLAVAIATGPPASAGYEVVDAGLVQWEWVPPASADHQITDIAVRPDGWLVVATAAHYDGRLHLVPPWGAGLSDATRFGPTNLGFRQLEVRSGRLYGLRQETLFDDFDDPDPRPLAPAELYELDLASGEVLRHLGEWWNQDLAVDPQTEELVLQTLGPDEPYDHHVARFDPDTGAVTVLVPDDDTRADDAREIAFTPDGELLLLAERAGSAVDVHRRDGDHLYRMQVGQADAIAFGRPGTCLAGQLLITRFDGTVLSVAPGRASTPRPLASGGRTAAISYAALDAHGNLLTSRLHDVTILACPPFEPPRAPNAPPPPGPPVAAAVAPAGAPPGPPAPPAASTPPPAAPPTPAGPPPPPAPPAAAPIATPGALGGAAQVSAAPSAAAADAPDEEHVTSLAASALAPSLLLSGAALAMAMVTYATTAGSPPPARSATATNALPTTAACTTTRRQRR